jgi:hypothetical protein
MVTLTRAEYQACWPERLVAKERAIVTTDLQDQEVAEKKQEPQLLSAASEIGSQLVGSQLSSRRGPKPPGSAVGSVVGSGLEADELSSLSLGTESIVSSHVSSASVSMRKIEMLKQQLEQVRLIDQRGPVAAPPYCSPMTIVALWVRPGKGS